jgi:hypothetical protein
MRPPHLSRPTAGVVPTTVPPTSFLAAYARRGAYTDCYAASVPSAVGLSEFIEAFYTTPLFKVERWLLARVLGLPSTDAQAQALAQATAPRFSAWRVEARSDAQILLDAGQTRSWLGVQAGDAAAGVTTLLFGSAVVPVQPGGRFGWAFHALLGFHRVYSRLLLAAAARRVIARRAARGP